MKHTDINLLALFAEGCKHLFEDYKNVEDSKRGNLRAGDSGALLSDGSVVGKCHRQSLARWLGQPKTQPEPETQSNFDTGYKNEDNWLEKLALSWKGVILCEEEIPIEWFTGGGIKVSGRPDMVLCDDNKVPQLVIEHKAVVSVSKAAKRVLGEIDTTHFLQACHYSMELKCPATVVYSFAGIGQMPWWVKGVDREKFWPKGKGWEVKPFKKEFKIGKEGECYYYVVDGTKQLTEITEQSIRDYYAVIEDMAATKNLYKRHSSKDLLGKTLPYNVCDYCELKSLCDQYEGNYDLWVDHTKSGKD